MKKTSLALLILFSKVQAEDLGAFGKTYEIAEQDALEFIQERLAHLQVHGAFEQLKEKWNQQVAQTIKNPKGQKLQKTNHPRRVFKDLTVVLDRDLLDPQGRVIHKSGTHFNVLTQINSFKKLIFIDGEDAAQVIWAQREYQRDPHFTKLVLIAGAPLDLMEKTEIYWYFDQAGHLTRHFGIEQVPARVSQDQDRLLIEEIQL